MSGGHWDYQQYRLREQADTARDVFLLVAELEACLDWGISGDTCERCARLRTAEIVEHYFSTGVVITWRQTTAQCHICKKRDSERT